MLRSMGQGDSRKCPADWWTALRFRLLEESSYRHWGQAENLAFRNVLQWMDKIEKGEWEPKIEKPLTPKE